MIFIEIGGESLKLLAPVILESFDGVTKKFFYHMTKLDKIIEHVRLIFEKKISNCIY